MAYVPFYCSIPSCQVQMSSSTWLVAYLLESNKRKYYLKNISTFIFGMLSSVALGCPGLCLIEWLICLHAGRWVIVLGVLSYGKWCLLALCGTCGGNVMTEISRTKRGCWRSSCPFSFTLFT
jgi:hypothetical protein